MQKKCRQLGFMTIMLFFFWSPLSAQVSTLEILKRVIGAVTIIEREGNQVLFIQVDHISRGMTASQTYTLNGGSRYSMLALGDEGRITDIDLEVYDESGNLVGRDNDTMNIAKVTISAPDTGRYKFKVKAYSFKSGFSDGFYALVLYRID